MIRLIVDSSADFTPEEIKEKNLHLAPLSVTIQDQNYLDGVTLFQEHFYQLLTTNEAFPKTSQPSPQQFLALFEEAKANNETVIAILLSSKLSGTYQSAHIAKELLEYDSIYLIDTLSATAGIRILVEEAIALMSQGKQAIEIVEELEDLKGRIKVMAVLDTLEYLSKGGRLSKTAASIGDMVSLKPVVGLVDGGITVLAKRPGATRALVHFTKMVESYTIDTTYPIYSLYTYGTDNCAKFEEKLARNLNQPLHRLRLGPTLGSHIGPEAYGICFVEKKA